MGAPMSEHKELKSKWKNEVTVQTFTKKDVAKHNTKKDMWMTIHGKVYDVTEYARDHPGGLDALLEVAGTDATSGFEDVGHSEDARELLQGFLVGVLEGAAPEDDGSLKSKTAAPPAAQIVRRSSTVETPKGRSYVPEVATLAVGAAALYWASQRLHLSPASTSNAVSGQISHVGSGTLPLQLTLAAAVAGVVGVLSFRQLEKMFDFNSGFKQYPSYIRAANQNRPPFHPAGVLVPSQYRKFRLGRKEELSDGIWRFVFELPTRHSVLGLPIGQHVAIQAEIDDHTVVRSYTPVSNNRDLGRLELLIRVYPNGQVGNYLKALKIGDHAEFRGPKGAMRYRKGLCKNIGMVAGGTGITPMYQLIRAICEDPTDDTHVSLVYGNRSEDDIMLRKKLEHFAEVASDKFSLHIVLDTPSEGWKGGVGRVDKAVLAERLPKPSADTKIMLCGPPGMINAMKQNLTELGFESPGAVGKMTDQVFCF